MGIWKLQLRSDDDRWKIFSYEAVDFLSGLTIEYTRFHAEYFADPITDIITQYNSSEQLH